MALADERQQVMLAQGVQLDVLDQDHLAGIRGKQGVVHHFLNGLPVAASQELEGLGGALGGVGKPRPVQILAYGFDDFCPVLLHRICSFGEVKRRTPGGRKAGDSSNPQGNRQLATPGP